MFNIILTEKNVKKNIEQHVVENPKINKLVLSN